MSYNTRQHNRSSGRFNRGGFVSGGLLRPGAAGAGGGGAAPRAARDSDLDFPRNHQTYECAPALPAPPAPPQSQPGRAPYELAYSDNPSTVKTEDVDMNESVVSAASEESAPGGGGQTENRPGFKTVNLVGVKKVSKKERRRRQNALLRRLTTPKNALMCINEMLPQDQIASQFKVEPVPMKKFYSNAPQHNFCAELVLDGVTYRGSGETKISARNACAENAIRDIMLKKMERVTDIVGAVGAAGAGGAGGAVGEAAAGERMEAEGDDSEEALPMIQLLSFALHKLFAEWEGTGYRVPMLHRARPAASACEEDAPPAPAAPAPRPPKRKGPAKVPDNAAAMHPCMLLPYLAPGATYREGMHEGDKPNKMMFEMIAQCGTDCFSGRGPNKKEARKEAARAACRALHGVVFDDERAFVPPAPDAAAPAAPAAHIPSLAQY